MFTINTKGLNYKLYTYIKVYAAFMGLTTKPHYEKA